MNRDHALRPTGLRVLDPLAATTIAAARLHLLAPAEVLRATGRGHAWALYGRSVSARGLTLTDDSSRALCPPTPEVTPAMPAPPARPASDAWRDAEGTPIALQSRVEQVAVDTKRGALPSRLHQQGQVIGRGTNLVYVLFNHDSQLIALRPHLLRVLDTPDGC